LLWDGTDQYVPWRTLPKTLVHRKHLALLPKSEKLFLPAYFLRQFFKTTFRKIQGKAEGNVGCTRGCGRRRKYTASLDLNVFVRKTVLRPVAQLYGHVRTDWNRCFVIDCSLSHSAGYKPFTFSHSVLRNT